MSQGDFHVLQDQSYQLLLLHGIHFQEEIFQDPFNPSFLLINRSQPVFQFESIIHTFIIFHFKLNYSFLKQRYKNEQRSKFKFSADFWHNKDACNHLIPNNMFVGLNQLRKSSFTISMKFFCHVCSLKLLAVAQYNEI